MASERLRLGIVANEFFDWRLGAMGGFGFAARQVARTFAQHPALGVDPVFFAPNVRDLRITGTDDGIPVIAAGDGSLFASMRRFRRCPVDLLLTIDFRPSYRMVLESFPRTPALIWVRDPRTPHDIRAIHTLRIPDKPDVEPAGIQSIHCELARATLRRRRILGGCDLMAAPANYLRYKIHDTYGVTSRGFRFLPTPLQVPARDAMRAEQPTIVYLGRLDPIKRPWIVVELARRFPDVRFRMLGANHFSGAGSWQPNDLPANVELCGHLEGDAKYDALADAWALLNTSIHESLPMSFLEALATGTPPISFMNPDGVTSRYGFHVPWSGGTGLDSLPTLDNAMQMLLDDPTAAWRRAEEGSAWVRDAYSPEAFLDAFESICRELDVVRPVISRDVELVTGRT